MPQGAHFEVKWGMAKKRIVVFSPHPDDAEYGAWGFLHQNRDEEITIVLVSGAVDRLHETQKHQDYFSESHLEAKDRFWGYRIGVEFAEPFFAYKIIF